MRACTLYTALMSGLLFSQTADAHSLKWLNQQLIKREKYFQPIDKRAPDFALRDLSGRDVTLQSYRAKIVVLNFIFTRCPDFCPLHTERIAKLQKMINMTPMKGRVQFLTITTDPKNDRRDILKKYAAAHGLDRVNWTFLTTRAGQPLDTTRQVALAYGLKFTQMPNGRQMHGVVTHVIDQDGIMRARFHGLKFEPLNLVMFVNALTNRDVGQHDH